MGNPITWFEMIGADPEKKAAFYAELFGWHTESMEGGYITIDTHAGSGMNGGVTAPQPQAPGTVRSVFYAEAPDIQAKLDEAGSLGARTLMPVTVMPDIVTFALFADPWGNHIGLMQGDGSGSPVSTGDNPPIDWVEIGCAEPKKAWDFYRELFGWTIEGNMSGEDGGPIHGGFDTGGSVGARGGIGSSDEVPGAGRGSRRSRRDAGDEGGRGDGDRHVRRSAGGDVRPLRLGALTVVGATR